MPRESAVTLLPLFDIPETVAPEEEEEVEVPSHTRKKGGRESLPETLPRIEKVHDIDDDDKICAGSPWVSVLSRP